ncbi:MAG: response regulator transcription factor, partial [Bacteroidota bacterium]
MSGRELAGVMKERHPTVRLLALTMHNDRGVIHGMKQAGVSGYLLKNTSQDELLTAIRRLAAGKPYYSSEVTETLLQPATEAEQGASSLSALTGREREVLVLIADGYTNTQIGEKLFISPRTVDSHRTNLMKKLDVHNMAGLIRFAYRQGLVQ